MPEARIGEYVTVARREKNTGDWYLGAMTNSNSHQSRVNLDFLDPKEKYVARIFADGDGADYETNPMPVAISEQEVDSTTQLNLALARGGGAAVIISKKGK